MLDRVKFRYEASLVIEKCLGVVDKLFANAGGGSVFKGSKIQDLFLDVHTSRAHVANIQLTLAEIMALCSSVLKILISLSRT